MLFNVYAKTVYGKDILINSFENYNEAHDYVIEMNDLLDNVSDPTSTGILKYFIWNDFPTSL